MVEGVSGCIALVVIDEVQAHYLVIRREVAQSSAWGCGADRYLYLEDAGRSYMYQTSESWGGVGFLEGPVVKSGESIVDTCGSGREAREAGVFVSSWAVGKQPGADMCFPCVRLGPPKNRSRW